MKKLSNQEFIARCFELYGDSYDYSLTVYKSSKEPVAITCKIHGEFSKPPNTILAKKSGCPSCGNAKKGQHNKLSKELVEAGLAEKYPKYAPFSLIGVYNSNTDEVMFKCRQHGEQKSRISYLRGLMQETPCPVCNVEISASKRRSTQEDFITLCKEKHNNKYDYSKTIYLTSQDKISVICPEHGMFQVEAMSHKLGTGCSKCYVDELKSRILPYSEWLARAVSKHGNLYGYDESSYKGTSEKLRIICKDHGEFWQLGNDHTNGSGCPTCTYVGSKGQAKLAEFVRSLDVAVIEDYRIGEGKLEVDCYLPEFNLAIEYDGLKWHSTQHRPSSYHLRKRNALKAKGIDLIRVFEDEWQNRNKQVKALIENRVAKSLSKLSARKCDLADVDNAEAKKFYEENHIQGWNRSGRHSGLYYDGELVAVMTFTQSLSERGVEPEAGKWELARFASKVRVVGAASRLFRNLLAVTEATTVVSYSDDRLFTGSMYPALGFEFASRSAPSYTYWKSGSKYRLHKSHFRHSKLPSLLGEKYNPNLTERANCEAAGYYQVYDCGLTKWIWQCKV